MLILPCYISLCKLCYCFYYFTVILIVSYIHLLGMGDMKIKNCKLVYVDFYFVFSHYSRLLGKLKRINDVLFY